MLIVFGHKIIGQAIAIATAQQQNIEECIALVNEGHIDWVRVRLNNLKSSNKAWIEKLLTLIDS